MLQRLSNFRWLPDRLARRVLELRQQAVELSLTHHARQKKIRERTQSQLNDFWVTTGGLASLSHVYQAPPT
ncbi:hypothetical protein N9053_00420 [bacterium]|nr:hypothetical protein [bacterium]MDB4557588.1 hypothetical protein [bacterium]